jgi:hypothetical protein
MSLIVTVQVTRTTSHLEQIHNIVITNLSLVEPKVEGDTPYAVTIDGKMLDNFVYHDPNNGALALISDALEDWRRFNDTNSISNT